MAAAWSRSNFPPPALDKMFRAVEAVYRIDKQFLAKLNDIGPNPSSPKALGDLLMRWVSLGLIFCAYYTVRLTCNFGVLTLSSCYCRLTISSLHIRNMSTRTKATLIITLPYKAILISYQFFNLYHPYHHPHLFILMMIHPKRPAIQH